MTHLLPHQDPREPNSSVLVAAFCVLRRQPWKTLALRTWDPMKRLLQLSLLAASLGAILAPALAHARTYDVMHANVPFKFNIGDRTFRPGHYQLIFVGPGLIALRDSHEHVIASLVTRSTGTDGPSPVSKLVFSRQTKHPQLAQIWIENRSQVLEVLGEEVAMRPIPPLPAALPPEINSLFERRTEPRLKH
jgi:hypothetical protein